MKDRAVIERSIEYEREITNKVFFSVLNARNKMTTECM